MCKMKNFILFLSIFSNLYSSQNNSTSRTESIFEKNLIESGILIKNVKAHVEIFKEGPAEKLQEKIRSSQNNTLPIYIKTRKAPIYYLKNKNEWRQFYECKILSEDTNRKKFVLGKINVPNSFIEELQNNNYAVSPFIVANFHNSHVESEKIYGDIWQTLFFTGISFPANPKRKLKPLNSELSKKIKRDK